MKHNSIIEILSTKPISSQLKLRSFQVNPEVGQTVWIPGRLTVPEKILFEPQFRMTFEPYNKGRVFLKEWQCAEYMKAEFDLAMKYQMKFYGTTIQQDLFGNIEELELIQKSKNI